MTQGQLCIYIISAESSLRMVSWFAPLDHKTVVLDSLVAPMALLSHQTGRSMSVTPVMDECKSSLLMAHTSGRLDKVNSMDL